MTPKGLARIRLLFAQEAEQRLGRLGQLVLELEAGTVDGSTEVVHEIFREVHTLKGSAAVVGFERVGRFAHVVEERLSDLRSGTSSLTPAMVDALLVAIDRLAQMINDAIRADGDDSIYDRGADLALAGLESAFVSTGQAHTALVPTLAPAEAEPPQLPASSGASVVLASQVAGPVGTPDSGDRTSVRQLPRTGVQRETPATVMVPVERLDELVRMVGEAASAHLRMGRLIGELLDVEATSLSEFGELSRVLNALQERAMRTRMVPVSTITDQLQRAVRDAARALGKQVRWEVRGEDTELDRGVLSQLSDALLHLVRNAVDHGLDSPERRAAAGKPAAGVVRLHAMQLGSEVIIVVADDGAGVDLDRIRARAADVGIDTTEMSDDEAMQLIFRSGFSTSPAISDISGRGVGLDVVRDSVESARGRIELQSTQGAGTEFRLVVPITLAVLRCLLVVAGGQRYAMPLHRIALAQAEDRSAEVHAEGRRMICIDGHPVPVSELATVLDTASDRRGPGTIVVVDDGDERHAFVVDSLLGQRDVVVKGLSALVPRLGAIAGASVEPDGSILLVLDPPGLVERAASLSAMSPASGFSMIESNVRVDAVDAAPALSTGTTHAGEPRTAGALARILVVDDALTIRELQRSILERAGFDVVLASDGLEALQVLDREPIDLVLTDVEMPEMDGFALTEQIRLRPAIANTAVLIITSLDSDRDRRRGMDAGADGYIVKNAFDEQRLIGAVVRLLGARP